jgi:hypothetical protein
MAWEPELEQLGAVTETQIFSFSVKYFEDSAGGGDGGVSTPIYYPVKITADEINPTTILITNGTTDSTISGFYGSVFNDTVKYMKNDLSYITVNTLTTEPIGISVWNKIPSDQTMREVIEFTPDLTRIRVFNYTCVAGLLDNSGNIPTPIATTVKQIIISDRNWTPGKNALQAAVAQTRL